MEPGKVYHIYNRGNNKEDIFKSPENYRFFLQKYDEYLSPHIETLAYCLMPNHFHFMIRIKEVDNNPGHFKILSPAEKAFKNFFISYAKAFNKMYDRTGSLFQYKFKRKEVDNEAYYSALIAYIHLNPVEGRGCRLPQEWKFSSYRAILSSQETSVSRDEVLGWFGGRQEFIEFHGNYFDTTQIQHLLFDY